ncbi:RNA methyltransferase [bacterium]|nr:RNA methyltransferase [bacterium]
MKISSKDNPLIKYLTKIYSSKKERDESSKFIVEGYNLVNEAYKTGSIDKIFSIKEEPLYKDAIIVTYDIIKKITDTVTPEGIIALVNKKNTSKCGNKILYLDSLQDPGNIGTLLRSAVAFNFDTIVLDECTDLYNPKTIRASQGAIFYLNFIDKKILDLKQENYYIINTNMNGVSLDNFKLKSSNYVLILGNEGHGVRREYQECSDVNLTIPMENIESLNVSIAGSILMYELNKQEK